MPWTILYSGQDAEGFSDRIESTHHPFPTLKGTAIGNGIRQAGVYLSEGPECARRVLDISGDGIANAGVETSEEANALSETNVTINGLVLPQDIKADSDPYMFYVRHVARGQSSFVMDVTSYSEFPRAMQRKLLRELVEQLAMAAPR